MNPPLAIHGDIPGKHCVMMVKLIHAQASYV